MIGSAHFGEQLGANWWNGRDGNGERRENTPVTYKGVNLRHFLNTKNLPNMALVTGGSKHVSMISAKCAWYSSPESRCKQTHYVFMWH